MGRKSTERQGYSKSAGQTALYELVHELYPEVLIKQDLNLRKFAKNKGYSWSQLSSEYGQSLSPIIADIVLFNPFMIFEYNGQQHYKYTSHWHGDADGYKEAQERDNQKIWFCQRMAIPMVVFSYKEVMDLDTVRNKIEEAISKNKILPGYTKCNNCGLIFLEETLLDGVCTTCVKKAIYDNKKAEQNKILKEKKKELNREQKEKIKTQLTPKQQKIIEEQKQINKDRYQEQKRQLKESEAYKNAQKNAKEKIKEKNREYKESDAYKAKKEEQKQIRKEYLKKQKDNKQNKG